MSTNRKGVIKALGAALIAISVLYIFAPSIWGVHVELLRARFVKASLESSYKLCEKGPEAEVAIVESFAKHGAKKDVNGYRAVVFRSLACLREESLPENYWQTRKDHPVDTKVIKTMAAAFDLEPSAARREDMFIDSRVDFRFNYALYSELIKSKHPIPYPYGDVPGAFSEESRKAWCELLPEAASKVIFEDGQLEDQSHFAREKAWDQLLRNACDSTPATLSRYFERVEDHKADPQQWPSSTACHYQPTTATYILEVLKSLREKQPELSVKYWKIVLRHDHAAHTEYAIYRKLSDDNDLRKALVPEIEEWLKTTEFKCACLHDKDRQKCIETIGENLLKQ